MSNLSGPVISLLVVLLQFLDPSPELSVTYLQDSRPLMEISIAAIDNAESDVYQVVTGPPQFPPSGEVPAVSPQRFRIEQSDLYAHVYIVHMDGGVPLIVDAGAIRRQLVGLDAGEDRVIQMGGAVADTAAADAGISSGALPGGELYWQSRPPVGILSYPAGGVILIAR